MSLCPPEKITIAVDGFSSCGKSTFAREIAARLGYVFIDSGAMYRAVTLYAMRHGAIECGVVDNERLVSLLDDIQIDFRFNRRSQQEQRLLADYALPGGGRRSQPRRGASDIYVDGQMVESEIRTIGVSNCVSSVSSVPRVREKLVAMQQAMGRGGGIVMDGRDIGTAVFPHAQIKIFMTADMAVRVRRRYDELRARGEEVSREQIEANIRLRDHEDQQRKVSPLRRADDALLLDNSHMTVAQQMEWFEEVMRERCKNLS